MLREIAAFFGRRLSLDRNAESILRALNSTWSVRRVRARVIEVVDETADVRTFVLRPNARWRGHIAGQHTAVDVAINGVRLRRYFSISSAPSSDAGSSTFSITVKRLPDGIVSRWLHERAVVGTVLDIEPAAGAFVLPGGARDQALLFVSAGSGITPVMSMLRELGWRDAIRDVVFIHYARAADTVIFRRELEALAARHPSLRLVVMVATESSGRFDEARLRQLVPDFAARTTLLCAPPGLMARVEAMWAEEGATERLQRERFAGTPTQRSSTAGGVLSRAPLTVTLSGTRRVVTVTGNQVLLEELEAAGERTRHACRMGLCHTCACRKRTGRVRNVLTGARSSEPDEEILLCLSVAETPIELAL